MAKQSVSSSRNVKGKSKRPGVHSKKKSSKCKTSKNYKKQNVGQG